MPRTFEDYFETKAALVGAMGAAGDEMLVRRSGTVFNKQGLSPAAIATHKAAGVPLLSLPAAEAIPTELAIRLVSADIVVDATPSTASDTDAAVQRGRAALQCGASLVLCSKNGLAEAAADWLQPATRARIGVNAVLGGTIVVGSIFIGLNLLSDLLYKLLDPRTR